MSLNSTDVRRILADQDQLLEATYAIIKEMSFHDKGEIVSIDWHWKQTKSQDILEVSLRESYCGNQTDYYSLDIPLDAYDNLDLWKQRRVEELTERQQREAEIKKQREADNLERDKVMYRILKERFE